MADERKELQNTLDEGKRLWALVQHYAKLELVDKLTFVMSVLIVGGILLGLCIVAVFCFCMFVVTRLGERTGDMGGSYCLVGFAVLVLALLFILLRKTLVTRPVIRSLMKEFFAESGKEQEK